ncbi:uncharacterized protein LOC124931510 [Impatiens glandulifera]|uniref:uncharacterized protein LOC124931510 n=1 Tax=Impatiens glandulifera TaxID=253017 RepID=UPI001FB0B49A|nr:uncharacterized protein LOC124931510 [Impatiens glandulifera]
MEFIRKIWFICFAIPFLSTISFSQSTGNRVKSAVFRSPAIELEPGSVSMKYFYNLDFPRGHIAIKGVQVELVDENNKPIPSGEAYLHHWIITRYYQRINTKTQINSKLPIFIEQRNSGLCEEHVGQYFGLGSESQKTISDIPDPYGIEVGNPSDIPAGYVDGWAMVPHIIDTRGVEDRLGCTECVCELYNLTQPGYIGGLFCCGDETNCRLKSVFKGREKMKYYMRYIVKWVDFDDSVLPVRIYILDVTDSSGEESIHNCQLEYEVEPCDVTGKIDGVCKHVKRARFRMPRGGGIVYAVGHLHTGGITSTLYRQDGEVICSSRPSYEEGKEPGDEESYISSMSVCYPATDSVKILDGEIIELETNYSNTKRHTGVMGLFYLLLADSHNLHQLSSFNSSSSLLQVSSSSLYKDFVLEKVATLSVTVWGVALFGLAIFSVVIATIIAKRKIEERKSGYESI